MPPPPKPEPLSIYERGPPQPLAIYAFDAGHIDVMAPNYLNIYLTVPMRLPKLFETHGLTRISTHFAHDHGQMAEPLQGPGFTISPGRYRIREENAHSDEDGDPREARFSAFSISIAPTR